MELARKILVIRSARMQQFNDAVNLLVNKFPGAEIFALVQPGVVEKVLENKLVKGAKIMPSGEFSFFKGGLSLIREIRKEGYDVIVLLYNNTSGAGYLQLDLLAYLSGASYKMAYDINEKDYLLDPFLKRILKELVRTIQLLVNLILLGGVIGLLLIQTGWDRLTKRLCHGDPKDTDLTFS